ncbi:predicted protein [Scheffersomyces stipitis CBS 6054]|uniref:Uncharacterized protein n=1 Tax=Scheffersomyces stipitis (strain ATCC 58785 / CBS 6054 / NBRC 10063 / NRRL Y-11545) TaxID=322104 RepID=A3LYK8_PICST|nr:predicted protein [Scheffersomyces stipitis CBS 6054]ABN67993.1 predicted protein [Scheffersomyces stipitis CBS 6054]
MSNRRKRDCATSPIATNFVQASSEVRTFACHDSKNTTFRDIHNINVVSHPLFSAYLTSLPQTSMKTWPVRSIPQDVKRSIPQDVKRSIPQDVKRSIPQDVKRSMPQDVKRSIPQDVKRSIPQDVKRSIPQDVKRSIPQDVKRSIPQGPCRYYTSVPQLLTHTPLVTLYPIWVASLNFRASTKILHIWSRYVMPVQTTSIS